jgi:hypothetical protein
MQEDKKTKEGFGGDRFTAFTLSSPSICCPLGCRTSTLTQFVTMSKKNIAFVATLIQINTFDVCFFTFFVKNFIEI